MTSATRRSPGKEARTTASAAPPAALAVTKTLPSGGRVPRAPGRHSPMASSSWGSEATNWPVGRSMRMRVSGVRPVSASTFMRARIGTSAKAITPPHPGTVRAAYRDQSPLTGFWTGPSNAAGWSPERLVAIGSERSAPRGRADAMMSPSGDTSIRSRKAVICRFRPRSSSLAPGEVGASPAAANSGRMVASALWTCRSWRLRAFSTACAERSRSASAASFAASSPRWASNAVPTPSSPKITMVPATTESLRRCQIIEGINRQA